MTDLETFDKFFAGFITIMVIGLGSALVLGWLQLLLSSPVQTAVVTSLVVWGFQRLYPKILRLLNGGDSY